MEREARWHHSYRR